MCLCFGFTLFVIEFGDCICWVGMVCWFVMIAVIIVWCVLEFVIKWCVAIDGGLADNFLVGLLAVYVCWLGLQVCLLLFLFLIE